MKKILALFMLFTLIGTMAVSAKTKTKKDVLKDDEYKELKTQFFNADGYGDTYNCKVEKQRFCKVKVLDSGTYVLCDRDVSRTQWESAKIFYKYGRCTNGTCEEVWINNVNTGTGEENNGIQWGAKYHWM